MSVMFEVERFEWAAEDRLELEGRWFGLRGRRFVRPTLEVEVDGEARRLLALMEHKPWQALDGEEWIAAFSWDGEPGDIAAELAVGADLTFELPQPNGKTARKGRANGGGATAAAKRPATTVAKPSENARVSRAVERRLADAELARDEAISDAKALRRAVDQRERTLRDLREQVSTARAEAEAARAEAQAARAEVAAAAEAAPDEDSAALALVLERVRQELRAAREEAAAADAAPSPDSAALAEELAVAREEAASAKRAAEAARREANAARSEPNAQVEELRQQLGAAIAAKQAAIEHVKEAERQRHDAVAALADAGRESGDFSRELQRAVAERDELRGVARTARQERDAAIRERDAVKAQLDDTKRERDTAQLARDAHRAELPLRAGVAQVIRQRGPKAFALMSAERSDDEILALRFGAFVALSAVCLLVAIWIIAF